MVYKPGLYHCSTPLALPAWRLSLTRARAMGRFFLHFGRRRVASRRILLISRGDFHV